MFAFGDGVDHMVRHMNSLWEVRATPNWKPARKWEPQSYNHRELHVGHNLKELGNDFFP